MFLYALCSGVKQASPADSDRNLIKTPASESQVVRHDEECRECVPAQQQGTSKIRQNKLGVACDGYLYTNGLELILTQWIECAADDGDETEENFERIGFCSAPMPMISIKHFLERIHTHFGCSDECFIVALVYMNRLADLNASAIVCNRSVHRLVFVAMMLAAKMYDDKIRSNKYYAKIGGLHIEEVLTLELAFLQSLAWKLHIEPDEYQFYHRLVCEAGSYDMPFADSWLQ
jgi:hypothetical protein